MTKYLSGKINIIPFFLMLMVVFLHTTNFSSDNTGIYLKEYSYIAPGSGAIAGAIEYFLGYGVCTVAVPIFFMISGYLFFLTFKATLSVYFYKIKNRFFLCLYHFLYG